MKTVFEKARSFIYRNARSVDLARWQYHFENGSRENVIHALSFYQNEDGGFGHGIEADFLNPNSSPMATWAASQIIREIGFEDRSHPMIKGMLRYLESGAEFDREHEQWLNTIPSNNDYPHAVWWTYNGNDDFRYNPTAALAAFIIDYADENSPLYKQAVTIAKQAADRIINEPEFDESHITGCFITLYETLKKRLPDITDMCAFEDKLKKNVKSSICPDTEKWASEYVTKPSVFGITRDSIFYEDNSQLAEYETEFIRSSQLSDGGFPVTWQWWTEYKEYEISAKYWQCDFAIKNMLYLRNYGVI